MTKVNNIPQVVFQPDTSSGFQKGIRLIASAVHPTLGPLARTVVVQSHNAKGTPVILDSGADIARRILELPDREANIGAMFARQVIWRMEDQVGDGSATTALLLESIYSLGLKFLVAGGNAPILRRSLDEGMRLILEKLDGMSQPVEGKKAFSRVARSICHDSVLGDMLGEIFDIIGEFGQLEIKSGYDRELRREYVAGSFWKSKIASREMISNQAELSTELIDPVILVTDLSLSDPVQIAEFLSEVKQAGYKNLLILADVFPVNILAVLRTAGTRNDGFNIVGAKTPGTTEVERAGDMEDICHLIGGIPIISAAGETLGVFRLRHLGRARRIIIDRNYLNIFGGKGDPNLLRQHISKLRLAYSRAEQNDVRERLSERIGKLMSGAATLWVGSYTEPEIEYRKGLAKRSAKALRRAARSGIVPGGGMAFIGCQEMLESERVARDTPEEKAAFYILKKSMEVPARAILENAGFDASEILAQVRKAGDGYGFDARTGKIMPLDDLGVWDVVDVVKNAVRCAIASAGLALTIDILVLHKNPEMQLDP